MEKMERPALGTLKPGDPVIVLEPGKREWRELTATVVKVARVWITVKLDDRSGWNAEQRFRLDTQDDGSDFAYCNSRFVTPEQHEYDERMRAARQTLTDVGVLLDHHSPFKRDDAATLALAERVAQIVAARVVTETTEAEGSS